MQYRRTDRTGATYFFTANLAERHKCLLVEYINELRLVVKMVKQRHPFEIDAMVVLPDHIHTTWTLPEGDKDYPTRWMLIKTAFSRHINTGERRNQSRISKRERGIWQRRYWEHLIRDEQDYICHVDYIHYNPVKHGYITKASEWQYSSIHRYIKSGLIDEDWGADKEVMRDGDYGEFYTAWVEMLGIAIAQPNLRVGQSSELKLRMM